MMEILKTNPVGVLTALTAVVFMVVLVIFALVYIFADLKGKVKKSGELHEHLIIGVSSVFLGISTLLTDTADGLMQWAHKMQEHNGIMSMQYVFGSMLTFTLIKHLIKQHKK